MMGITDLHYNGTGNADIEQRLVTSVGEQKVTITSIPSQKYNDK